MRDNVILDWLSKNDEQVIKVDKLTYAGNLQMLYCLIKMREGFFLNKQIYLMILNETT